MRAALVRLLSDEGLLSDEAGATAVEYALVCLVISIAAFSVIVQIGTSVTGMFTSVANGF